MSIITSFRQCHGQWEQGTLQGEDLHLRLHRRTHIQTHHKDLTAAPCTHGDELFFMYALLTCTLTVFPDGSDSTALGNTCHVV